MPRFARSFRCWSCGKPLPDGTLLDCTSCQVMLNDAYENRRRAPRIFAYPGVSLDEQLRGVIAGLRRELNGIIV